jgi:hypothetical protein
MEAGNVKYRLAAIFLAATLLAGCAGPREPAKPSARDGKPVSVRLPVLTPMKIEPPSAPPGSEPSIAPSDVKEGEARSLKMIEMDYTRGKPGPPVEEKPQAPVDDTSDQGN